MKQQRITRRKFLKTSSTAAVGSTLLSAVPILVSSAEKSSRDANDTEPSLLSHDRSLDRETSTQRLLTGWEYRRGGLGGPWEVWRKASDDANVWQAATLPHCFNAYDAVDPDSTYYQGPGWYRTKLKVQNPFPQGRTLLHFEGAGQKSDVYIFTEKVGSHVGGYDEFIVDITDAAASYLKEPRAADAAKDKSAVPLAVMCDNSRDLEMIPSNLSDFNLYGGLYRYLNLVYAPAISLERVHVDSSIDARGNANVAISVRLYNPGGLKDEVQISVQVLDPEGRVIESSSPDRPPATAGGSDKDPPATAGGSDKDPPANSGGSDKDPPANSGGSDKDPPANSGGTDKRSPPWPGEQEVAAFDVDKPMLWSPKNPALYKCVVTIGTTHGEHRMVERFGLRSFQFVTHGPFKLNGERLLLRGTQRHEDHAGLAAAMTEDLIRKEMTLIKEMGANFIRLGHHQQSRIVLDLCDELGLLVWEEIPWCRGGLGGERYKEQARRMLRNLIDQHRNHPSVIIWGLGNENDWPGDFEEFDKNKIRAFMSELNDLAHKLDPSRQTAIRRCEFCSDIVDVYSPSIWAGWYRGRYTEYKSFSEAEMKKVNHFLHAEWGGDSHSRRHSENPDQVIAKIATGNMTDQRGLDYLLTGGIAKASSDGDWSESYICNLFDWHLKEQETMEWLTGAAQWVFKDFSTPLRSDNPVPRMNQKGLVERDLTLKEGYYVFQSYWTDKPMVHIYGHSWPIRWGEKDERKTVKVYSNCPTVELFVNGASAGTKKRDSQSFPAAGLRWLVPLKDGENHVKAVGQKEGIEIVDEIRFLYQTQKWDKPAKLIIEEMGRNGDRVTVQARLVDKDGVLCLDARNVVRFGLTGDGRLLDNLGTSAGARKLELYNGRAQIAAQRKGEAIVSVSLDGLPTAFLTVKA